MTEHSNNYIFLFTCLTCGYLLVSKEALKILGAKGYWDGIDILPFVIVGLFFEFLYTFPVNYEMYCKKMKIISIGSTIVALVNIGLNFLLIPRYGMLGAAIATLIAYIGLFIIHDIIVRKIGGYHYKWSFYLKGIIPVIGCSALTYLLTDYMPVRWGIGSVIGTILK